MYMESNEAINKDEMNPYLKSTISGLAFSAATELGATGVHRITKNTENKDLQKIHKKMNTFLYNEGIKESDTKGIFKKMNLKDEKVDKYSKKIANNKTLNFLSAGLSTTKGRVNAYGLGTLTGLAFTGIGENIKEKNGGK